MVDLKRVCEYLTRCAFGVNSIIAHLKVEEGSLKVSNDEFGAEVDRLRIAPKAAKAEVGQGETIDADIGVI